MYQRPEAAGASFLRLGSGLDQFSMVILPIDDRYFGRLGGITIELTKEIHRIKSNMRYMESMQCY